MLATRLNAAHTAHVLTCAVPWVSLARLAVTAPNSGPLFPHPGQQMSMAYGAQVRQRCSSYGHTLSVVSSCIAGVYIYTALSAARACPVTMKHSRRCIVARFSQSTAGLAERDKFGLHVTAALPGV